MPAHGASRRADVHSSVQCPLSHEGFFPSFAQVGLRGGATFEHSISSHFLHGPSFIFVSSAVHSFSSAFGIAPVVQTNPHARPLIGMQSASFLHVLSTLMRSASSSVFASVTSASHSAAFPPDASAPPASPAAVAVVAASAALAGVADAEAVGTGVEEGAVAVAAPGSVFGLDPQAMTAASPTLATASATRLVRVRMRRRLACVARENNFIYGRRMRSRSAWRWVERFSFGGRIAGGVGLVLVLTIAISLVVAFGSRHTVSLFELAQLAPDLVLRGQVWRLVTWTFVELSPLSLLFSCVVLYFFGRDLGEEWGSLRFLRVYGATTLIASIGTCLVALVDRDALHRTFIGSWPLACAMTVAWGLWFPDREIRIWFVIPLKGIVLAWLTVALTVASAIYFGWEHVLPYLFAEGAMLGWLFRHSIARRASKVKRAISSSRAYADKRRSSEEVLRSLEEKDEDLVPLPPEIESLLGGKKKDPK